MNLFRRITSQPHFSKITKRTYKYLKSPDESLEPPLTHGIHVFHSPDAVGIVAKLSECIASKGGNILGADIFVPENKNVFYSRSEFVFDPRKWPREQIDEDFLTLAMTFNALRSVVRVPNLDPKYKIAVLASKQ
uniref:Formyltetrahydrofolate deformylase n=1 Tax=Opuntia streptacantha TaxID=393608 RepID=A0A7C9E265_OPUST